MKSRNPTSLWLIVFVLITIGALSGCVSVKAPEVGNQFREYVSPAEGAREALVLPAEPEVQYHENGTVWMTDAQFRALEVFVETAYVIEQLALSRTEELQAREDEIRHLVRAGQATELQAEVIAQMYTNEAQECRWVRMGAYGIAGLSILLLGISAL